MKAFFFKPKIMEVILKKGSLALQNQPVERLLKRTLHQIVLLS